MRTRSLKRSGVEFSEITLGTWGLAAQSYGPITEERFDETVIAAIDSGITTFDVAPLWGEEGASEVRIGHHLKEAGGDFTIITRGGARFLKGALGQSYGTQDLIEDCERSLGRLQREEIDVWLLHNPGLKILEQSEWQEAVVQLESEGKIRAWGVSVGTTEEARLALKAGAHVLCMPHNLIQYDLLEDLAPECKLLGCGLLAHSPLAYGLLAGQWPKSRQFEETDHRSRRWSNRLFLDRHRHVEELRFLVGDRHPDLLTAALRFVLAQDNVHTAIVGSRSARQMRSAAEASAERPYLTKDDWTRLRKVRKLFRL